MQLKDKIALITGGSSGIGKAISIALAKEGCKVIFTYNSNEKGADETLNLLGQGSLKYKIDLRDKDAVKPLFDRIKKDFGKLDILVNNAGANRPREFYDMNVWEEIFQINLFSAVACIGHSVELMKSGGKILNITSIFGEPKSCWKGLPIYGAAKAAVAHYTQTMAKNLSPNILINAIAPGYVKTPLWKDTTEEAFEEAGKEQLIERMIMPEEIAEMALAVIKNDAMTGEVVVVDGGISLKTI